ncbi:hypothetical protein Syn7803C17_61 [Synechococcus phage ACG-2014f]|jgi:hypothetical protein|uniref:Uncharacterized protein n=1 Tax=Synechococcus phage ACG-2014f TaxID=1493511 RepID=A0A0E3G2Q2_9CAUD|nr:hypothetical protein Syn7803C17_61 [Synechococcus phage ACG-2014f]
MTHLSFTQTTQNALRELDRLEGIKVRLAGLIVDLKETPSANSETWVRMYTDRLVSNVIPAIKEVKEYLTSQDVLVTKASN